MELWTGVLLAFAAGWGCAWALARSLQRRRVDSTQRQVLSLRDRADRLASEKVALMTRLERHGEDLAKIRQQLQARERELYAVTGTWPAMPPLKPSDPPPPRR